MQDPVHCRGWHGNDHSPARPKQAFTFRADQLEGSVVDVLQDGQACDRVERVPRQPRIRERCVAKGEPPVATAARQGWVDADTTCYPIRQSTEQGAVVTSDVENLSAKRHVLADLGDAPSTKQSIDELQLSTVDFDGRWPHRSPW